MTNSHARKQFNLFFGDFWIEAIGGWTANEVTKSHIKNLLPKNCIFSRHLLVGLPPSISREISCLYEKKLHEIAQQITFLWNHTHISHHHGVQHEANAEIHRFWTEKYNVTFKAGLGSLLTLLLRIEQREYKWNNERTNPKAFTFCMKNFAGFHVWTWTNVNFPAGANQQILAQLAEYYTQFYLCSFYVENLFFHILEMKALSSFPLQKAAPTSRSKQIYIPHIQRFLFSLWFFSNFSCFFFSILFFSLSFSSTPCLL